MQLFLKDMIWSPSLNNTPDNIGPLWIFPGHIRVLSIYMWFSYRILNHFPRIFQGCTFPHCQLMCAQGMQTNYPKQNIIKARNSLRKNHVLLPTYKYKWFLNYVCMIQFYCIQIFVDNGEWTILIFNDK